MCGIAGIYYRDRAADGATAKAMAHRLRHRGPDEDGVYVHGGCALAHQRLSIIDLQSGRQPLEHAPGGQVLIANAEIYNHLELRQELEAEGEVFATNSDCEPLLHGLSRYGPAYLQRVRGMYAFAYYDPQSGELLLARDRLGIKPLFMLEQSRCIAFASELKALLPLLDDGVELCPFGLRQALETNFSTGSGTPVRGIHRLAPGYWYRIAANHRTHSERYWSPTAMADPPKTVASAVEHLDALLDDVVTEHLRADVPIGVFLSSGLDSSGLLSLMARNGNQPIAAFTVGFAGAPEKDETSAAARIAARFGATHETIVIDAKTMFARLPLSVWAADELMFDYANLPTLALAENASDTHKVVFTGEGGDEVFAGYGRYRSHWSARLINRLKGRARGGFRARGNFPAARASNLFVPALAEVAWQQPVAELWGQRTASQSCLQLMQSIDIQTWLPDDLLVKADRMLMAFGVEGRVPWLDHRLVEFGLALPDKFKVSGGLGKQVQRIWASNTMPPEVTGARKSGFTVPIGRWFDSERLSWLRDSLPRQRCIRDWCYPGGVRNLIDAQAAGGRHAPALWALLQFAVWHALFVEGDGLRPDVQTSLYDLLA